MATMCDDDGINGKKVRIFKVGRPGEGRKFWITRDWQTILDAEFDGWENGDKITVEIGEMTEGQIEALPEFEGW